jgi:hypothetical protein
MSAERADANRVPLAALRERYRSGAWLTPRLTAFAALAMMAGTLAAIAFLLAGLDGTLDRFGRPLGTDFSAFWTAGRMALDGHAAQAYDWATHHQVQRLTHAGALYFPWSYPPIFLMVAAALAALPYLPALVVWQAATLGAALATYRAILPSRRALLLAVGFPGILICLGHGQTGFLTATLLAAGVLALPKHEIAAGILFGLLAYKPQFGLLLPFALAAGGHWRAIAAAAATVLASVGLTLVVWDRTVWQAFFDSLPLTRTIVFENGDTGFAKFQSAFAWVRLWGGSVPLAYALQALVSASVIAACVWIWSGKTSHWLKGAALLTGALLSSPYVLDYDFVVFGMALAFFAAHGLEHGFRPWDKTLLALAWLTPVAARPVAQILLLPLGFWMLAVFLILIVVRVRGASPAPAEIRVHS